LEVQKVRRGHQQRLGDLEKDVKLSISGLDHKMAEVEKEIETHQGRVEKLRELITTYALEGTDTTNGPTNKKPVTRRRGKE